MGHQLEVGVGVGWDITLYGRGRGAGLDKIGPAEVHLTRSPSSRQYIMTSHSSLFSNRTVGAIGLGVQQVLRNELLKLKIKDIGILRPIQTVISLFLSAGVSGVG